MTVHSLRPRRPIATMLLIAVGTVAPCVDAALHVDGARAADSLSIDRASPWDGDARSAARLIAGTRPSGQGAPLRAGIEIRPLARDDASGISSAKAERMLGWSPSRSWRDYLDSDVTS